jgi:hypothetical protein
MVFLQLKGRQWGLVTWGCAAELDRTPFLLGSEKCTFDNVLLERSLQSSMPPLLLRLMNMTLAEEWPEF